MLGKYHQLSLTAVRRTDLLKEARGEIDIDPLDTFVLGNLVTVLLPE